MRDLACCAGTMASYSTPSDLVGVGLANGGSINGGLAGGMVMSLITLRDRGVVVAVMSNRARKHVCARSEDRRRVRETGAIRLAILLARSP